MARAYPRGQHTKSDRYSTRAQNEPDWCLKNLQLVAYAGRVEVTIMERELARAFAFLALDEHRNARLPAQVRIASEAEHRQRFDAGVSEHMAFLKDRSILHDPLTG